MTETTMIAPAVHMIRGAWRDLSTSGRGREAFRQVWRDGRWQWVSTDRMPTDPVRSDERHCAVHGTVTEDEIVVTFDRELPARRCQISTFAVVQAASAAKPLATVRHTRCAVGYELVLPAGRTVVVTDPLAR